MKIPLWLCPQFVRNITRFYRTYGPHELLHQKGVSFGQEGEDVLVEKCFFPFRDQGFYVDIGAFDPFIFSNTHAFYKKGWHGINIEPNPAGLSRLKKHRRRDINLGLAVSRECGETKFLVNSVFSCIADTLGRSPNKNAKLISVETRPLSDILHQYVDPAKTIDFMSIDCEGHDQIVLESNDWNHFRPGVILIEDQNRERDAPINLYLSEKGYILFFHFSLTKIFYNADRFQM